MRTLPSNDFVPGHLGLHITKPKKLDFRISVIECMSRESNEALISDTIDTSDPISASHNPGTVVFQRKLFRCTVVFCWHTLSSLAVLT